MTATLTDPDGGAADTPPISTEQTDLTADATWKWERSRNGRTGWTEIEVVTDSDNQNPNANVYTPVEDDEGYFLRATASYDDGEGEDKTAEMVSYLAVRSIPYSNNTPVFRDADGMEITGAIDRSVAEDAAPGDPVGDPVQATDAAETGPDVLTYTLNNTDTFSIDSATGQIEVGAGTTLDYDTQPNTYNVRVTATDPSGLNDTIDVTINIIDVNETPVVTVDSDNTERTPDENFGTTTTVATFSATDEENSTLTWSLSGADGDRFDIDNGTLTFKSDPNFEAPADANRDNVYEVTAQASDGVNTGTLDITVTVGNVEEAGTVTLSNRQPEDNVPITAMLSDPDVAVQSSVEWQWEDNQGEISGATSATFRPIGGEQVGNTLMAKATYTDGHGPNKTAVGNSANTVQATDTDNKAPEFKDDDDDAITSVDIEVAENTEAGQNVGDPVPLRPWISTTPI